jgi:threonine/homoserine/homoserine lactone efflux protein
MNNKFVWAGIAYAVWLGVENWHQLKELNATVEQHNRWLVETFAAAGRRIGD